MWKPERRFCGPGGSCGGSPVRGYSATLGRAHQGEFVDEANCDMTPQPLGEVRWALRRVKKLARGRVTCLMLPIAGKRLLNRRGLPKKLILGVRPDKGADEDPFGAHAWLRAGRYVVSELEEHAGHIPVASYHSTPTVGRRRRIKRSLVDLKGVFHR